MHPVRHATAHRVQALLRTLAVLLVCLGLAGVSGAASGGGTGGPGAAVVAAAKAHVHDTYTWGGAGPKTWDCSGLTSTLWRQVGGVTAIPRTSSLQQAWAVPLPAEQVLPGDLVFFGDPATHVGIVESRTTSSSGTTVQMVDASSSQKGVVERTVWKSDTVSYGRVPRKGMVPVAPWTKSAPKPTPAPAPVASQAATPHALVVGPPLKGLPRTQKAKSSTVALQAATLVRGYLGNTKIGDSDLIRTIWSRAGGAKLPTTRDGIAAAARRVALSDARVGDLVVYGPPTAHIGIYVGNGLMISASRSLGKVVLRQVWASPTVHLVRLPH
ncbi:MAG: hypothetical protein JWM02_2497 [Frankiales bacterium]|nr:hypothetical protein [Frankiales bacterium]